MKKLIIGILISIIFIYFSFQGVEFDKILRGFKNANYIFLIPTTILFLLASLLRSLRWGVILSPIVRISQRRLFPITCVGYMATTLIPLRIGEIIRPYLASNESKIPLSSALATILAERIFDVLSLLAILFLFVFCSNLPEWLVKTGYSALVALIVLISLVILFYFKTEATLRVFSPLFDKLPQKFRIKIEGQVQTFLEGFKIISSPKRLLYTLLLSYLVWGCFGLGIWVLFFFFNFQLSLSNALVVLICTIIGVSLPAAPGMVGNFHYASIVALSIFGVGKSDALSFAVLYHLLAIGKHILLGLIFLPYVNLSFNDVKKRFKFLVT